MLKSLRSLLGSRDAWTRAQKAKETAGKAEEQAGGGRQGLCLPRNACR